MDTKKAAIALILICSTLLLANITLPIQAQEPTPETPQAMTSPSATLNTLIQDNFNDGEFNSALWDKLEINGGLTQETDGQLVLTVPSGGTNWSQAGYVTKASYDTQEGFEVTIDVTQLNSLAEMNLLLSDQKNLTIDPAHISDWLRVTKMHESYFPGHNLVTVEQRQSGFERIIDVNKPWNSSTGQLKITVFNDTISFYENGAMLYSTLFSLPSKSVYVYVYTSTYYEYPGTDKLDNFSLLTNSPKQPTTLTLSAKSSAEPNLKVNIAGALSANETKIPNAQLLLSYSVNAGASWIDLTTLTTDNQGTFEATWTPQVTGNYLIKAIYQGNPGYAATEKIVTLIINPNQQSSFTVESNSTITQLYFDSSANQLNFTASGPSGTTGYVNINIPKTLIRDIADLEVYIDQNALQYSSSEQGDSWLVTFSYHHSIHQITICMSQQNTAAPEVLPLGLIPGLAIFVVVTIAVLIVIRTRKQPNRSSLQNPAPVAD